MLEDVLVEEMQLAKWPHIRGYFEGLEPTFWIQADTGYPKVCLVNLSMLTLI